jgi:hypothetical protein
MEHRTTAPPLTIDVSKHENVESGFARKDPRGRSLGYPFQFRQGQGATVLQQAGSSASQHVERTGEGEE